MSETKIGEIVARQFDRVWESLRDALSKMSDAQYQTEKCSKVVYEVSSCVNLLGR